MTNWQEKVRNSTGEAKFEACVDAAIGDLTDFLNPQDKQPPPPGWTPKPLIPELKAALIAFVGVAFYQAKKGVDLTKDDELLNIQKIQLGKKIQEYTKAETPTATIQRSFIAPLCKAMSTSLAAGRSGAGN